MAPVGIDPMDMDGDSSDEVTSEALNGETKPDVAKLAQSAIIKQVSDTFLCRQASILKSTGGSLAYV